MKLGYSVRAFFVYFVVLGTILWFVLENANERLNDGMRQAAESVIVDTTNLLATLLEGEIGRLEQTDVALATQALDGLFTQARKRRLEAQIYQVTKTGIDYQVYVTDQRGIVVYDSEHRSLGQNFSEWRDVKLTLSGEYGARTSYLDQERTEPEDPKIMVVAAPINIQDEIVGVVAGVYPISSLEGYLSTESEQLRAYAITLLIVALVIGFVLSQFFTRSLQKISDYARTMAKGRRAHPPKLWDKRLSDLTESITNLRAQLDGKEYVEKYIHSLTHELKTPITSIQGATELLEEEMPLKERRTFIRNIETSNRRMSHLVERMLSLAKLESLTTETSTEEFDLGAVVNRLIQEREGIVRSRSIEVIVNSDDEYVVHGDKLLLSQAIANLLDNAIDFSFDNAQVLVTLSDAGAYEVSVTNQGDHIPDFALDKIYDRFFSLPRNSASDQKNKSTGLGLTFVRQIALLHKGSIELRNIEGGVRAQLRWPHKTH